MKFYSAVLIVFTILLSSCSKETTQDVYDENLEVEENKISLTTREKGLFDMVNDHRDSIGIKKLEFDTVTYLAAMEHNQYMINQGEISHDHFDKRAEKLSKKVKVKKISENVANNYKTNKATLKAWLKSATHKNNIEADFTHSGLSILEDAHGNYYITQIFFK